MTHRAETRTTENLSVTNYLTAELGLIIEYVREI